MIYWWFSQVSFKYLLYSWCNPMPNLSLFLSFYQCLPSSVIRSLLRSLFFIFLWILGKLYISRSETSSRISEGFAMFVANHLLNIHFLKDFTSDLSKGFVHYKTITSENVSSNAQVKNFFNLWKSYVFFIRYSRFCIFKYPMIYQIIYQWHDECMSLESAFAWHH